MINTDLGEIVRHANRMKSIYFDIGSKNIKIAYLTDIPITITTIEKTIQNTDDVTNRLHCIQVKISDFAEILEYISKNVQLAGTLAHFACTSKLDDVEKMIEEKLGVTLVPHDVFDCIGRGTTFLLKNVEAEAYTYSFETPQEYEFKSFSDTTIFPYILINIRTGLSILKVNSETEIIRLGGSSIGGGSFVGLSSLLTGEEDIEKLMEMAQLGDPKQYDKLISDVYGDKANTLGLPMDLLAASFAKGDNNGLTNDLSESSRNNLVASCLRMVIYNATQMAHLYACTEKVSRVFFNGYLVRNRPIVMKQISYAFNYWTQGKLRPYFLRHENYTTAIGAFSSGLNFDDEWRKTQNWKEHYSGSTALGRFVPTVPLTTGFKAQTFELDCLGYGSPTFYLLCNEDGPPDTINLNKDSAARDFWLDVMEETIPGYMKTAIDSQENITDKEDLMQRAEGFSNTFKHMLRLIKEHPVAYGNANARNILELREQILKQFGFDDIYVQLKEKENLYAIKELPNVLKRIDDLKSKLSHKDHIEYVCRGLLAGNVFDWGAKEVAKLMNRPEGFSFTEAVDSVEARPWLFDNYDQFYEKCTNYRSILIFVDNSGCDYLLGVIPFVREMLRNGSYVIIAANSSPALNDLTVKEMRQLISQLQSVDQELDNYITTGKLLFTETGQASPCLDLRRIHVDLNALVIKYRVDLIVIEGMGRALHTNFNVKFRCDSLKVAVIKTKWLADRLGGKMFSVVFRFDSSDCQKPPYTGLPPPDDSWNPQFPEYRGHL